MRAAVLHEAPGDLVIEDLDIASPTGREVLIRTKASGLCHSDLHVIEGLLPAALAAGSARPRGLRDRRGGRPRRDRL